MIEDVFASTGFILFCFENIPQSLYGELVVEASHAGESEIATCVVLLKLTYSVPPFFITSSPIISLEISTVYLPAGRLRCPIPTQACHGTPEDRERSA